MEGQRLTDAAQVDSQTTRFAPSVVAGAVKLALTSCVSTPWPLVLLTAFDLDMESASCHTNRADLPDAENRCVYPIGDIARLGGVSARMLRHHDKIGLFRPAAVNANGPDPPELGARAARRFTLIRLICLVNLRLDLSPLRRVR